jgi:hypothetical protein
MPKTQRAAAATTEAVCITILGMVILFIALGILMLTARALDWLFRPKREAKTKTLESDDWGACLSAGTPASPDIMMGKEEQQRFRLGVNKRGHDIGMGDMKRSLISAISTENESS